MTSAFDEILMETMVSKLRQPDRELAHEIKEATGDSFTDLFGVIKDPFELVFKIHEVHADLVFERA